MPVFTTYDGLELAYDVHGDGEPALVLPGGPLRPAAYLGDLGGADAYRRLVVLHHRGTGDSPWSEDLESYRCDRMVGDVEALRAHLGLEQADILGHSAGANLAVLYAAAHPDRVRSLALITPSLRAVGMAPTSREREAVMRSRSDEPWFEESFAAYQRYESDAETADEDAVRFEAFFYGRWDDAARAHVLADLGWEDEELQEAHIAPGVFTPEETRAALGALDARVLLVAGEVDASSAPAWVARLRDVFAPGTVRFEVLEGGGHYPWVDDAEWFAGTVGRFWAGDGASGA